MNYIEKREWGNFEILSESDVCKVKQITVNPKQRLSYQYHYKRSESWIVVQGQAKVTINGVDIILNPQQNIYIPKEAKHRIENISKDEHLIFIEVQMGEYFGEDDIVRIEDDYNRK